MAPKPSSASPAGQHVLLGLCFQELSWDHTSPEEEESVLWLEFDGNNEGTPVNKLLKIYSKQVVGFHLHWRWWGGGAWAPGDLAPPGLEPPGELTGPGLGRWLLAEGFPVLCDRPAPAPSVLELAAVG